MNLRLCVLSLIAIVAVSCSGIKPTKLRTDYVRLAECTTINSTAPMFSWQISQESKSQSAYQIIVSRSQRCKQGDMWQSGRVQSNNNFAVAYAGQELQAGQSYYWRVRYWDDNDEISDFSDAQMFTMSHDFDNSIVTRNPLLSRIDYATNRQKVGSTEYLFDFGRAAFGTLSLEFTPQNNMTITVRAGEQLNNEGRIEQKPRGTIRYQEVTLEIKKGESLHEVIFKKDRRNTGTNAIPIPDEWGIIMPYRYVEVIGLTPKQAIEIRPRRNVMYGYREELGQFESSNNLLDSIWEICRYTIQATDFAQYYIDGDRERIPYEADAYINQLCHYGTDSEYAIGKSTLEYFMSNATWPTEWLLHTIMIAYQDYIYTGDTRLVTKYYDTLKAKTLYEIGREDGLINAKSDKVTPEYLLHIGFKKRAKRMADIVDWPMAAFTKGAMEMGERDGHEMMPINTAVNAFHFHALRLMSEVAQVVGKMEDSRFFEELSLKVKESINTKLFDSQRGVYIDGEGSTHASLHSNMLPLAFGIVEPQNIESVAEFVKSRGMACSVYGAQYLFEALYSAEQGQYALDLMTNRSDRGWYNMIRTGSTMTLEAWDIKYKGNLDWNHAWGAAPANLIPREMWGVKPIEAGFTRASIKPQLANLTSSSISIPTLQGEITASYSREGRRKVYNICIPANMTAIFECVDTPSQITVNGEIFTSQSPELGAGENIIVVELAN